MYLSHPKPSSSNGVSAIPNNSRNISAGSNSNNQFYSNSRHNIPSSSLPGTRSSIKGGSEGTRKKKLLSPVRKRSTISQLSETQLPADQQRTLKEVVLPMDTQHHQGNMASRPKNKSSSGSKNDKAIDPIQSVKIEEVRKSSHGRVTVHHYLRGKLLGKGGFAKVYMCTALDTQKAYAIKIVPKANLVKTRARQKLQAEIKIHRTLKHRFICEYKHFFEDRTNCYILLELCENQSMNELIRRRKRLTEPEVMYYFQQLIDGTSYMHSNNIIHRDLKLGNLFLDRNLVIKIGDLGLATKLSHSDDRRKTICGTPNYIAPEIINGNKSGNGHSFEVDIWSMGVILFTLLVGKPPYESKDVKATYQRILKNEYSYPKHVHISDQAKDLINSMLQTAPCSRPNIDQVRNHELFTSFAAKIPLSLPANSVRFAPVWYEDSNGHIVAHNNTENPNELVKKKKHHTTAQSVENKFSRRPLSTRDQNQLNTQKQDLGKGAKEFRNLPPPKKSEKLPGNGCDRALPESKRFVAFKVYDDNMAIENGDSEKREQAEIDVPIIEKRGSSRSLASSEWNVDALTTKTSVLSLGTGSTTREDKFPPSSRRSEKYDGIDVVPDSKLKTQFTCDSQPRLETEAERDLHSLESMHIRLSKCLKGSEIRQPMSENFVSGFSPTPTASEIAPTWVTRYVDYTSKYGLGFLLNDGSAGVYFNDSTKALLSPSGNSFHYVERRKSNKIDGPEQDRNSDPVCDSYSLSSYPEALQKKVTLLKHFCNYLVEQQKRSADEIEISDKRDNDAKEDRGFVYLKKWVRTRHAILFRLSNRTVQIVFFDHTEVLLSNHANFVTYVGKSGDRTVYPLDATTMEPCAEITKRLRYAKDIIHQLISGSKS